jgi:type II secretory pathway pseudopilin PulG
MIVLAILALLAAIIIFALNPAQLFARARDSQRFADLRALTSAINYYLVVTSTPILDGGTNILCVGGTGTDTI